MTIGNGAATQKSAVGALSGVQRGGTSQPPIPPDPRPDDVAQAGDPGHVGDLAPGVDLSPSVDLAPGVDLAPSVDLSPRNGLMSRRGLMAGAGLVAGLAACGNGIGGEGGATLDARVDATRNFLASRYPVTNDLTSKAVGILYMPLVTEAGFGFGGSYGRGALRIGGISVDYYSATRATFGFQIGAQQYAHALFFMTEEALADFRTSDGWAIGADAKYALSDQGGELGIESTTVLAPVIALVFGQAGAIVGATLEGTKYTRIIP